MLDSIKKLFGRKKPHYLVVGLGNPGPEYKWTRHNAGFSVVESFARVNEIALRQMVYDGLYGEGETCGMLVGVLKPATFMNLSGSSVDAAVSALEIPPERLIIVHDDLDLPEGKIRIKLGGGSGGHKGLKSIIDFLSDDAFIRLRLGIGRPLAGADTTEYVLESLGREAWDNLFVNLVEEAEETLDKILEDGLDRAMNEVNRD